MQSLQSLRLLALWLADLLTSMKFRFFILLVSAALSSSGVAADLPPALKPLTDQFERSREAAKTAGDAQLAPPRERYLAALSAAQKTATAAAKTADLAALAAEIEGVQAGALPTDAPPDLPRALAGDRRSYVTAAANVTRTVAQRQRELATKYLQSLTGLEASALKTRDAALGAAVADEKRRVLALLETSGGGAKHRNVVANGDFSQGVDGSAPPGWKNETEVAVSDALLVAEGGNKFLRFRRLQALRRANLVQEKEIPIPANAKSAEFSARMRVKGLVAGKDWGIYPSLNVSGRDVRGEEISKEAVAVKEDSGWRRVSGRVQLPSTAKTLKVAIGPHGAAGIIDFDDVEVEFR